MTINEKTADLAVNTLIEVRDELGLDVSDDLILDLLKIQLKYQFEQDRTFSHQKTEEILNSVLDQFDQAGSEADDEA